MFYSFGHIVELCQGFPHGSIKDGFVFGNIAIVEHADHTLNFGSRVYRRRRASLSEDMGKRRHNSLTAAGVVQQYGIALIAGQQPEPSGVFGVGEIVERPAPIAMMGTTASRSVKDGTQAVDIAEAFGYLETIHGSFGM